jgi:hypothetical protein
MASLSPWLPGKREGEDAKGKLKGRKITTVINCKSIRVCQERKFDEGKAAGKFQPQFPSMKHQKLRQ